MTRHEALTSMAQTLLRMRGEWQRSVTSNDEIDLAVNQISDMLPNPSREACEAAVSELRRRLWAKA